MSNEYYNNGNPLVPGTLAKAVDLNTDRDRLEVAFDELPTLVEIGILKGATVTTAELNILDGVTATAAEINLLDGVTATTAEINLLDGITASLAEINLLDGITASTAEFNLLDGVTATTAEINILDGVTASTAEINLMDGVTVSTETINLTANLAGITGNVQSQINSKAAINGQVYSGTHDFTGGHVLFDTSVEGQTLDATTDDDRLATTSFVQSVRMYSAVPQTHLYFFSQI